MSWFSGQISCFPVSAAAAAYINSVEAHSMLKEEMTSFLWALKDQYTNINHKLLNKFKGHPISHYPTFRVGRHYPGLTTMTQLPMHQGETYVIFCSADVRMLNCIYFF